MLVGLIAISDQKIFSAADKRAVDRGDDPTGSRKSQITLAEALERYKVAMQRKERSARTIAGYQVHVDVYFADWKKLPLRKLAGDPDMVARRHDHLSEKRRRETLSWLTSGRADAGLFSVEAGVIQPAPSSSSCQGPPWPAPPTDELGRGFDELGVME